MMATATHYGCAEVSEGYIRIHGHGIDSALRLLPFGNGEDNRALCRGAADVVLLSVISSSPMLVRSTGR
eukprot:NODE_28217_length_485_cov_1.958101.p2 GENE.NODE_28217_length_485_cov_1.958101~~NODE_28217_length_485_cov_1.958101.p2  ORF type:complete len:69 (+),score=11.56 NODE_28217_length_485_cov_1.958101:268-474(+)